MFPCFGAPNHPEHSRLSQHGIARSQVWTFDSVVMDDESGVSVRLSERSACRVILDAERCAALAPTSSIRAVYDRSFHLAYVVTLAEYQLSTELHVMNTSTSSVYPPDNLEFQALLHNYIRAPADHVLVFPLQNKTYYDKTEMTEEGRNEAKTETRAGVDVRKYTDSVYEDASEKYEVTWPGGGVEIGVGGFKDVVVWNPQRVAGSKIGDMEDGGWCVGVWVVCERAVLTGHQGEIRVCRAGVCKGIRQGGAWPNVDWTTSLVRDSQRAEALSSKRVWRRPWI